MSNTALLYITRPYTQSLNKLRALLIAATVVAASPAFAANYATCILDKAPGVANDVAAQAVYQVCLKENPGAIQAVPQGSGRGLMGYNSGADCVVAKAKDTRSNQAATMIGVACRRLYDQPNYFDQFDPSTAKPLR